MMIPYKWRRRLSIGALVLWLPLYVFGAMAFLTRIPRPEPFVLEILLYAFLGVAWALPLRAIFKGVGRAEPQNGPNLPRP